MTILSTEIETLLSSVSNVYTGNMPDDPNDAVCIYLTGGFPRGLTADEVEESTFQIKVRNDSYPTGEALCDTIDDLLNGVTNSGTILGIYQMSGPFNIGRDLSNRQEWTINFRCYNLRN